MKKWRKILGENNEIHVKIGEVKIGHPGDVLKATLGSCVGIVFIWRKKNVFGLAHCLLPDTEKVLPKISARSVCQAVPSLINLLQITPEDIKDIEVLLVGGGNMMAQLLRENKDHIGLLNIAAARKYLTAYGFKPKEIDVGGSIARQVFVDCTDGEVFIERFEKTA